LLGSKEEGIYSLKICDFGLAAYLPEGQLATGLFGSPSYLAPEVLEQKPYGKECDIWSIGIVIFGMLSGTLPFYDEDYSVLFEKIKRCDLYFQSEVWNTVSAEAKDFLS
jgi:serine/threonine protein kinase